jgi:hypothetical protein
MKKTLTIDIANAFSKAPAGRYVSDGPTSGEVFRTNLLVPALLCASVVRVVLDGTEGYGSSFLDEAFAGLLREHSITGDEFYSRVELVSDEDPSLVEEVLGYVADESQRQAAKLQTPRAR